MGVEPEAPAPPESLLENRAVFGDAASFDHAKADVHQWG
jgi:hypothetical protein